MQYPASPPSRTPNPSALILLESIAVIGSVGGTVASILTQQFAMACIPLSLTMSLSLLNRQQQRESLNALQVSLTMVNGQLQKQQKTILDLTTTSKQVQDKSEEWDEQDQKTQLDITLLKQQQQKQEDINAQFKQQDEEAQTALIGLSENYQGQQSDLETVTAQLTSLQTITTDLGQEVSDFSEHLQVQQSSSQALVAQTGEVETLITTLREIDTYTQAISAHPDDAESFFQRGLIRQQLQRDEDQWIALDDFSQALNINPDYADAYYHRGEIHSALGNKRQAIADLRMAAKLYFEQGELSSYDQARNLSVGLHELLSAISSPEEQVEQILVETLFA